MLKKIYKSISKVKYKMFGNLCFPCKLPSTENARKLLEKSYNKTELKTDYNEKFLFEPSLDLSIIIPVYKVEKFLKGCIDSCIQETKFSYEIILVDDGSPDNSGKICDEYAKKDKRIRVIHKENGGVSSARNLGIVQSKGKYLMFVDSDDYLENGAIDSLLKKSKGFDIVQGKYKNAAGGGYRLCF